MIYNNYLLLNDKKKKGTDNQVQLKHQAKEMSAKTQLKLILKF